MSFLVLFQDVFLLEDLESVELVVLGVADQQHLGVGALADDRDGHEILERGVSIHGYSNIEYRHDGFGSPTGEILFPRATHQILRNIKEKCFSLRFN